MRLHYFADYEGYEGGRPILWGQVTHSIDAETEERLDPAEVVSALRQRAAEAHDIEPRQVRLCQVARL
ncbi:hypothetical protein P6166_08480 [Stenotrophomonas sp. HITSZ_GD]|uniref:hypothetical protein n=1 Tax=Stenotrophomonas sp. HITSZ_GD TaxID=3037248 RepID=UPI00240D7C42|nr:hypothetical protein [Stenotrophomonas sp. HITSZ_GD]MDG2525388.1 hypothetical protein [Stenotrophomonas sp. HITSZ_GD]